MIVRSALGSRRLTGQMFFNDEKGKNSVSFLKHYFHCQSTWEGATWPVYLY
jgi:hypothetical protein